jgi:clan AA aspartic protease
MGEVKVRTKLVNHVDEVRAREGEIPMERVRTYETDATVDTGAVRMIIPQFVLEQLGIGTNRGAVAEYADGRKDAVRVSDGILINIMGRETIDEALILGDEVLIGQTVLEKMDLLVDCHERRVIANPAHPDQPVSKVK